MALYRTAAITVKTGDVGVVGRTPLVILALAIVAFAFIGLSFLHVFETPSTVSQNGNITGACSLSLVRTIPLPNTNGRIDHMAIDAANQQLFVAALGNDSVAIIDLRTGGLKHSITELSQPQGVAFVSGVNRIYVSNAGNGVVDVYDSASYQVVKSISLGSDADNMRYDSNAKLLYVGYGDGGIAVLDATNGEKVGGIGLGGHPESFQLEESSPRIFANVPTDNSVVVLDHKTNSTESTWSLQNLSENFPMALDESNHRLFIGTRAPSRLVVIDTSSGKPVTSLGIPQDADDIFYNTRSGCIFVSSGQGFLTMIRQNSPDQYVIVGEISTSSGARTSFFSPELNQLYVAAPQSGSAGAKIFVYRMADT